MPVLNAANAARFVSSGGVIAYPTEAVYGIGCDPFNDAAVDAVRELKGRPADKGMIVLVPAMAMLDTWVDWSEVDRAAVLASWPGPVTWILPATDDAPGNVCTQQTLAVRIPDHPPMLELLQACQGPLVSTSANAAGSLPATTQQQVTDYFGNALPIVEGQLGDRKQPTEIRDARSGQVLRNG